MRFFLNLSYDGTNFAGWQIQPNAPTIQEKIEESLSTLFQKEIKIVGCGRTDSGVHAKNYIAHCDLPITALETGTIVHKINLMIGHDIVMHDLIPVSADRHARFDAVKRTYCYNLHFGKDPFNRQYSTYLSYGSKINLDLLKEAATIIDQTKNFLSFCKAHGAQTSHICEIYENKWSLVQEDQQLSYLITANRFLRGMVRLIVGSMINIGVGKLSIEEFETHIKAGTRSPLMKSAPAQGLTLTNIEYPF